MMTQLGHQCWGSADGLSISLHPSGWCDPLVHTVEHWEDWFKSLSKPEIFTGC